MAGNRFIRTIAAVVLLALAGCTHNAYLGNAPENRDGRIVFVSKSSSPTKASGADAAAALGDAFIVQGAKTIGSENYDVFKSCPVKWDKGEWTYLTPEMPMVYWDPNSSSYSFAAFSGGGTSLVPDGEIVLGNVGSKPLYSVSGAVSELVKCYASNYKTVVSVDYGQVPLTFRNLGAKVRLAFFENISGYNVADVRFYDSSAPAASPMLYADSAVFPSGNGKVSVSYPDAGIPVAAYSGQTSRTLAFQALNLYDGFIGHSIAAPSFAGDYVSVLPRPSAGNLKLRVSYTLVPEDGTSDRIRISSSEVVIPAEYTGWQSNHAYTYFFKIGTGDLEPVVFDAVQISSDSNVNQTITITGIPSITTSQRGDTVQVRVTDDDGSVLELTDSDSKLYTARITDGAAFAINEASVATAFAIGHDEAGVRVLDDGMGGKLMITPSTGTSALRNMHDYAVFKASALVYYVYRYTDSAGRDSFKVIYLTSVTDDSESLEFGGGSQLSPQTLGRDFVVYGSKVAADGSVQSVFDGTPVTYSAGRYTYSPLRFWDRTAGSYSFFAYTPVSSAYADGRVTFASALRTQPDRFIATSGNNTLDMSSVSGPVGPMVLEFSRLHSIFRLGFFCTDESFVLTNVRYTVTGMFPSKGDYKVDVDDASFSLAAGFQYTEKLQEGIQHSGTAGHSAETAWKSEGADILPVDAANARPMVLEIYSYDCIYPDKTVTVEFDNPLQAFVPVSQTAWGLNTAYTYLFKISSLSVSLDLCLRMSIADWMEQNHNSSVFE